MAKVKITEGTLRDMVEERVKKVLNEEPALALNYYDAPQVESSLITEIARINTDESNLFPYKSYDIQIWSNDHTPPHFHVLKDGWDVEFYIENGDLYRIKKKGDNKQIYSYMVENIKKWLSSTCVAQKKITNKENALLHWESLHED